ncbi:MAG TPA: tripartite tricarboxylate transporter TctB family protein, partial [Burkholderiaceae bacterium]|nr:tripartite tricarboxylate transporter TctB family protein [Burkholderiaceae bacterium]
MAGAAQVSSEAGYAGVGPNFLPWVVGSVLALCGGWLTWESLSGGFRALAEPSGSDTGHWRGFAFVSAGLLLNAALITTIGFILSCTLCFVVAVRGFKSAEDRLDLSLRALVVDAAIG